jgi:C-terminal processing protease CtpA/Prc
VFITDCCAVFAKYGGGARRIHAGPVAKAKELSPLFRYLLFERCGTVSITSSKPGEASLVRDDGKGSVFTYPFAEFLRAHASERLTWDQVIEQVGAQVKQDFDANYRRMSAEAKGELEKLHQTTQTVHMFIRTPALGARVKEANGALQVVQVIPLSPADHARLSVGDVVLTINGKAVTTEKEYSRAVDDSARTMHLTVRSEREGPRELTAELNR